MYVTHDQTEAMTMGDRVAVLKKGLLQQVAAPQELYDHPVNLFVAAFIGSPAMNLVEATLDSEDGAWFVRFGSNRLRIDDAVVRDRSRLRAFDGKPVVMGVRPEDLEDTAFASDTPPDRRLRGPVELREAMGAEAYVHFTVDAPIVMTEDTRELAADEEQGVPGLQRQGVRGGNRFVARMHPRTRAREGEAMDIAVDTQNLHFFDPETGDAIYADGVEGRSGS
jgi:multiple sugar transport system ATP-binding protein